jgi:PAS domain S-box-containing protein
MRPSSPPRRDQHESGGETASLRARLEEAEAVLSAIRSGAVDAITTETAEGVKVFTLEGSEHPYRVIVETMTDGAVTVTPKSLVLYCNKQLASMLNADLGTVVGSFLPSHFPPSDESQMSHALFKARTKGQRLTASLRTKDGKLLPVSVAMEPLPLNGVAATVVVLSDLTEVIAAQEAQLHLEETRALAAQNETLSGKKPSGCWRPQIRNWSPSHILCPMTCALRSAPSMVSRAHCSRIMARNSMPRADASPTWSVTALGAWRR